MTLRTAHRLQLVVLVLALLSVVPTVAADLAQGRTAAAPLWTATVVPVYLVLLAVLVRDLLRGGDPRPASWALVLAGDAALATFPLAAGAEPSAPWVLALSPLTVGAGAVALRLRGALLAALGHLLLRLLLQVTGVWAVSRTSLVLDSLLLLVVVAAVSVTVQAVQAAASQVATAREAADTARAAAAAARAAEREHVRWDGIVHDDVLASLSLTAQARDAAERAVAVAAAAQALERLRREDPDAADHPDGRPPEVPVPLGDLLDRLREAAGREHAAVLVTDSLAGVDAEAGAGAGAVLTAEAADALVAAAAEAVRNAVRHGGGGTGRLPDVHVELARAGAAAQVTVTDDGVGFDPARPAPGRFGLAVSVHRRTAVVGGSAEVTSSPGGGTVVRLRVPVEVAPARAGR
ncbi:ATP-binding protein [Kineococcus rubinsiae]|uniref:ATP-binding protein n=1 Tax=Kineococcus rubinsiae TaxID=2609562 RepID=UPI001431C354|nr:ATP-binding protein [Kineococcus rubinsiae]NIZ91295.1 hypothetical protein [Kineococcus rubinsiae]